MTLEEFRGDVLKNIKTLPANWRKGQKVFNYISYVYHVSRKVQFEDKLDCFYDDSKIDKFIEAAYKHLEK